MTNFSHDNREPPMLNDSERPVLPSLNSTTSGRSGLKIFIFVALFGLISVIRVSLVRVEPRGIDNWK